MTESQAFRLRSVSRLPLNNYDYLMIEKKETRDPMSSPNDRLGPSECASEEKKLNRSGGQGYRGAYSTSCESVCVLVEFLFLCVSVNWHGRERGTTSRQKRKGDEGK